MSINDLAAEFFRTQLGGDPELTLTDAEIAFYESVVADPEGKSLSDLRYAFYAGVLNGDISLGGGGGSDPVVTVLNLPGDVSVATGTWSGTITVSKFESFVIFDVDATVASAGTSRVLITPTADIPFPLNGARFWEDDFLGGSAYTTTSPDRYELAVYSAGDYSGRFGAVFV